MITTVTVDNFKTFRNLTVDLRAFNLLIGANASGKSNFVSIFRFLSNALHSGLDNAVSIEGGARYIRNVSSRPKDNIRIRLSADIPNHGKPEEPDGVANYELVIRFDGERPIPKRELLETRLRSGATLCANRNEQNVFVTGTGDGEKTAGHLTALMLGEKLSEDDLFVASQYPSSFFSYLRSAISSVAVYDIEPGGSKYAAIPMTGKSELEETEVISPSS